MLCEVDWEKINMFVYYEIGYCIVKWNLKYIWMFFKEISIILFLNIFKLKYIFVYLFYISWEYK